MQLTPHLHQLTLHFSVPTPLGLLARSVNLYLIVGRRLTVIDSGVAGSAAPLVAYLRALGRAPQEIDWLILTHSHPDHLGGAQSVVELSNCQVAAHRSERAWIEDPQRQAQERPVPGFAALVEGGVSVARELADNEQFYIDGAPPLTILHTPGHSAGSLSLWAKEAGWLISGDAVPVPGDLPIFDDYVASLASLQRLRTCDASLLLSAWQKECQGAAVAQRLTAAETWLRRLQQLVRQRASQIEDCDPLALCRALVNELGLPPAAANPLVARSFAACLHG